MQDLYKLNEVELIYKNKKNLSSQPQITKSKDAYDVLLQCFDENKIGFVEEAKLLLLNRANRVLGVYHLATGGVAGVVVDPKLVFIAALKANASSIILAHNHPSENIKPSQQDKALTDKMENAGKFLEITLLDHLIVTPNGYYSFADQTFCANDNGVPYATLQPK